VTRQGVLPLFRRWLRPHWRLVLVVVVAQVLQTLANLHLATISADLIDKGVIHRNTQHIWYDGRLMLVVTGTQFAFTWVAIVTSTRLATAVGRDLRIALFRQVLDFSVREVNSFGSASLISRITNDVQQVQLLTLAACQAVVAPIACAAGIFLALRQDSGLAVLLALSIPALGVTIVLVVRRMVPHARRMQQQIDDLNRVVREQLIGIRVVRAYVTEERERARFAEVSSRLTATSMAAGRWMGLLYPAVALVANGASIVLIWWGGERVAGGRTSIGSLFAFLSYLLLVLMAVAMASIAAQAVPRSLISAERIQAVLATDSSLAAPTAAPLTRLPQRPQVELRNATFTYPGADNPVLDHVNLVISPGRTTAVIGSTGSGKTTLLNLVARLLDTSSGAVLLGGVDVRELDPELLSSRIGLVPQKAHLFTGTVGSNLRHGRAEATDEECWQALHVAQAAGFVAASGQGLAMRVEQGGRNVSGGQRQRLAIARAIVRQPDLYLFDDCLSALDVATEARLLSALRPLTRHTTTVVVAQRLSTARRADEIVVLDEGVVVGTGTHSELLATCPTYRQIARSQGEAVPA
jgi:ATP-binding cassette subfamily B multidrug efflux pump